MNIVFRVHAIRRMFERGITAEDVARVIAEGDTVESYPQDRPYPSRLMLGFVGDRPVHVVCAENAPENELIVITVYEPDPGRWTADFRRKLP